VEMEFNRIENT